MNSQILKMNHNPLSSAWTSAVGILLGLSTYFLNVGSWFGNVLTVHPFIEFMWQVFKAIIMGGSGYFGAWAMKAYIAKQIKKYGNVAEWLKGLLTLKKRR